MSEEVLYIHIPVHRPTKFTYVLLIFLGRRGGRGRAEEEEGAGRGGGGGRAGGVFL